MNRFTLSVVTSLAALSLCAPVTLFAAEPAGEVVVKMGGIELTLADARKLLEKQTPEVRAQLVASPAAMEKAIRAEIMRRAVLAEAASKHWEQRPEVADLLERAREQVIVGSYVSSLTRPAADYPSEQEIKAAYEANKAALAAPVQYHVAQIYLVLPEGADKATTAAIERKAAELAKTAHEKGADFAALARKSSEHRETAANGGDMGWLSEDRIAPEMRSVIAALAPGEVSGPIKLSQGWHILKLLERKDAAPRSLDEVRDTLVQALRRKKAQENEAQYLQELASKTPLAVNGIALGKLVAPQK
jgi:hypothetical protein